jgi:hypothetical protein
MGEPVNSMEMVHGGGTLSVTSGKTVHFLDILGCSSVRRSHHLTRPSSDALIPTTPPWPSSHTRDRTVPRHELLSAL